MVEIQITPAREAAFSALLACEKQGAWSDQAIKQAAKKQSLSARDAALAANLCYGVVQNRLLLDAWIDQFSRTPPPKLEQEVRISLHMGLYQLHFLDRVPDSAAVNESVNLTRKYVRNRGASGLVNAVLRSFQRSNPDKRMPEYADRLKQLSVQYSHPIELVQLLSKNLHSDVEPLLAVNNKPVPTTIQVNTLKITSETLKTRLEAEKIEVRSHPWLPDCMLIRGSGDLEKLESFRDGLFYVQDSAARLAVLAADLKSGENVLDACAAPGGKSFASAVAMGGMGTILSCDIQEKKLSRIKKGAERLGIACISTNAVDGRTFCPEWEQHFDVVLADVPCSGLGIIRKKPDIRYKDLHQTEQLPMIQLAILNNVAKYVKPNGRLIYSTCTVLERENQSVVFEFLKCHPEFQLESFNSFGSVDGSCGYVTLWPHIHGTDGFFFAKLRRTNE